MKLARVTLGLLVIFLCTDAASCLFCGILDWLWGGSYYYPYYYRGYGRYYYYPNYGGYRRRRFRYYDDYWNDTDNDDRDRRYRRARHTSRCWRDSTGYLRCRSNWPRFYGRYATAPEKAVKAIETKGEK